MSLNIQDILNSLEAGDTAEESFAAGLTEEKTAEAVVDNTTEAADKMENDDMQKVAEELDAQGRIIARAFMDELQKIAVADAPVTVNTSAQSSVNPGVELANGDIDQAQVAQVAAILAQMQAGTQAGGGSIDVNGAPVSVAGPGIIDETPIAADAAAAQAAAAQGAAIAPGMVNSARGEVKQASDEIIGSLYNTFFGE